ncbi:hypothetical protein RchiOBHm_Chr2g0133721 [Rosa chinensis]|uniref:Transmembrane protein n=1 Tax=Rosa chinensis TaxID=74649 RepID=A0A2P6RVP1_ROSCH|nr:hypothetical protein RchiOBHm_Chr2g0133721 [Rosa chinensis]
MVLLLFDSRFGEACSIDFLYEFETATETLLSGFEKVKLSLLQYGKACCWDLRAKGLHRRRCSNMFIGTLPGMVIGTLPGMVHRDVARHVHWRRCSGMLSLTSLTPEGAVVRRACNRKEKVVESDGMRSEPFVFQPALLPSPSCFSTLLCLVVLLFFLFM